MNHGRTRAGQRRSRHRELLRLLKEAAVVETASIGEDATALVEEDTAAADFSDHVKQQQCLKIKVRWHRCYYGVWVATRARTAQDSAVEEGSGGFWTAVLEQREDDGGVVRWFRWLGRRKEKVDLGFE
ncbi:hypothetical protein PIB30_046197 [Stylosanthes scabra]|uniref:Uncharacterized protein n=1 Tax=Stylosanthes scabra TaxID=79078 RepID=A0ABU6ZF57_9FABA|nr:hypothetical protein [Stylosanthes scabra]